MKKGNIITFKIDRIKQGLQPSKKTYGNILVGHILNIHNDYIRVGFQDIWGNGDKEVLTIQRKDVIEIV